MLGAGQTNSFSAKLDGLTHLFWSVRVGAHSQRTQLVGPTHELHEFFVGVRTLGRSLVLDEALDDLGRRRLDVAFVNVSNESVQGKLIAFLQGNAVSGERLLGVIDRHAVSTAHADLTHLTRHQSRMRGSSTLGGEDPVGSDHATKIFRRSGLADQNHILTFRRSLHRVFRGEIDLAGSCPGTSRKAITNFLGSFLSLGVEDWGEQMPKIISRNSEDSLFLLNEALLNHIKSDINGRKTGALSVTGLQHPQFAFLDRKLYVLHITEMLLKLLTGRE